MAPRKIEQLDLRKEAPSHEGVSIQEYLETFKRDGKVSIPSPDGMGIYTVFNRSGGYYVPQLVWSSFVKDDYDRHSPSRLKTNQGREILWYPKGLGVNYAQDACSAYKSPEEYFLAMAKMVIGFIIAGRTLYTLRCGANINSLNQNEDQNYPY